MSEEQSNPAAESTGTETVVTDNGTDTGQTMSYMEGKYDSISALESGYKELQSSYSKKTQEYKDHMKGFDGAPEAYELSEGITGNDQISAWGLENGLSNDGYNALLTSVRDAETSAQTKYQAEQMEALGINSKSRVDNATDWVRANLGEDAVEGINSMWVGAKGIEAIEKLMKMSDGGTPANVPAQPSFDAEKVNEMQFATDQYGQPKMDNPEYAAKVRKMRAALMK